MKFHCTWRDVSMAIAGAVAMCAVLLTNGCSRQTTAEFEAANPKVVVQEGVRISTEMRRLDDPSKGVSCYIFESQRTIRQEMDCVVTKVP